jgi:MFS family permease
MTTQITPEATPANLQSEEAPYPRLGYAWYVVGVLTLVYIFSFIDRQILTLLVAPLRRDFQINDTQVSLLMGPSFAAFYTLCGIPFGRLADSKSRRALIAVGFVFWSVMTALCGMATNYTEMLLFRLGVGVGEATLGPAAFSLITDYFRKERLATAISVYSMGIYVGAGLASVLPGILLTFISSHEMWRLPLVGAVRSWQVIFFIVGLPGVLFALLLYTVKEPPRRGQKVVRLADGTLKKEAVPAREVLQYILKNKRTFIYHSLGFGCIALSTQAGGWWIPTYLSRNHGWETAKAGIVVGTILAISGTAGIIFAGRFSDWLSERGYTDAPMRVGMFAALCMMPAAALFYLAPSGNIAAALYVPLAFFASAPFGVAPAAIQQFMPNSMRGQASAIYIFTVNVLGLSCGPPAVALITERVFHDPNAIRYALLIVVSIALSIAVFFLWRGLRWFRQSIEYLQTWMSSH